MTLARQRQDLIDEGIEIPYVDRGGFVCLDKAVEVISQDDDGYVYTEDGVFYSIDLEFKEGQLCKHPKTFIDDEGVALCWNCQTEVQG